MSNSFSGINIGLRALQTQQKSLDVTGHNIANADNEDYSRQKPIHASTKAYPAPGGNMPGGAGQIGTGVKVSEIKRLRDDFINSQVQQETQNKGKWDKKYEGLSRIETTFNEPTDNSLSQAMDNFWEAMQDLSNDPESSAARSTVQQRGLALTDTFRSLNNQLMDYKESLNNETRNTVDEINSLSQRIADLNKQIGRIENSGNKPNDLLDKRNALLTELNKKVNIESEIDSNNLLNISLGGVSIVQGRSTRTLDFIEDNTGNYEGQLEFSDIDSEAHITNGELAGILETRDDSINKYKGILDNIAESITSEFNKVHKQGYNSNNEQGSDFFETGNEDNASGTIELTDDIKDNINNIAAGNLSDNPRVALVDMENRTESDHYYELRVKDSDNGDDTFSLNIKEYDGLEMTHSEEDLTIDKDTAINIQDLSTEFEGEFEFKVLNKGEANVNLKPYAGSGSNASALADVFKEEGIVNLSENEVIEEEGMESGEASIMDAYDSLISTLGVEGQRANQMVENQDALLSQLNNRQESTAGVSLDEEMGNMVRYQQAYNAAARVISTNNQMLDSLMQILR